MNFGATLFNILQLTQLERPMPAAALCASCTKPSTFSIAEDGGRAWGVSGVPQHGDLHRPEPKNIPSGQTTILPLK